MKYRYDMHGMIFEADNFAAFAQFFDRLAAGCKPYKNTQVAKAMAEGHRSAYAHAAQVLRAIEVVE